MQFFNADWNTMRRGLTLAFGSLFFAGFLKLNHQRVVEKRNSSLRNRFIYGVEKLENVCWNVAAVVFAGSMASPGSFIMDPVKTVAFAFAMTGLFLFFVAVCMAIKFAVKDMNEPKSFAERGNDVLQNITKRTYDLAVEPAITKAENACEAAIKNKGKVFSVGAGLLSAYGLSKVPAVRATVTQVIENAARRVRFA